MATHVEWLSNSKDFRSYGPPYQVEETHVWNWPLLVWRTEITRYFDSVFFCRFSNYQEWQRTLNGCRTRRTSEVMDHHTKLKKHVYETDLCWAEKPKSLDISILFSSVDPVTIRNGNAHWMVVKLEELQKLWATIPGWRNTCMKLTFVGLKNRNH